MSVELASQTDVSRERLEPGDVLLLAGVGDIPTSIAALDGSPYSHVALALGGELAIEAKLPLVKVKTLTEIEAGRPFVDVYRHRALSPGDGVRVVSAARAFESAGYSASALLLNFALVAVLGQGHSKFQDALSLLAASYARDQDMVGGADRPTLTCAELVSRAYADGGLPLRVVQPDDRRVNLAAFLRGLRGLWAYRNSSLFRKEDRGCLPGPSSHAVVPESVAAGEWLLPRVSEEQLATLASLYECVREEAAFADLDREPQPDAEASAPLVWEPPPQWRFAPATPEAISAVAGVSWPHRLVTPRLIAASPDLGCLGRLRADGP